MIKIWDKHEGSKDSINQELIDDINNFVKNYEEVELNYKAQKEVQKIRMNEFIEEIKEECSKMKISPEKIQYGFEKYSHFFEIFKEVYSINKNKMDAAENLQIFIDKYIPYIPDNDLIEKLKERKMSDADVI